MIKTLNREEIIKLISCNKNLFICYQTSDGTSIYVSENPIEINKARFRITIYYNKKNITRVELVAVKLQTNDKYQNCDTNTLHLNWLKNNYGKATEKYLWGVKYILADMDISAIYDPRSGSNSIVVSYKDVIKGEDSIYSSYQINSNIQKNILNGNKISHSTSYPIIYFEEEKYYLAFFTFFFSQEDIKSGMVSRPTSWVIVDIVTGEIIEERDTNNIDFSDASYDVKYNICVDGEYDTSKQYYDKAFSILDDVRNKLITTGTLDKTQYQIYLNKIIANIPKEYQRFYRDLSV